jgi:hypothetical protein
MPGVKTKKRVMAVNPDAVAGIGAVSPCQMSRCALEKEAVRRMDDSTNEQVDRRDHDDQEKDRDSDDKY